MVELKTVQSKDIESVWKEVEPLLLRICDEDQDVTLENLKNSLTKREQQLWTAVDQEIIAVAVTQVDVRPNTKVCVLYGCAGNGIDSWVHFVTAIENWARDIGCDFTEVRGRKGWEKVLKGFGWELTQVIIRKKLNGEST